MIYKAPCSELLERHRAPLNKEEETKEISFFRSTLCRKTFSWWIPEDFLRATKDCLRNASIL